MTWQWAVVEEDLTRALIRLGRLRDAEDVLLRGRVTASLRADLALAHRLTSPQDTLRLLEGIDRAARWRDAEGRKLLRIGIDDLAKASAALAGIRPERSAGLARRAADRAWGRTDWRFWAGMLDALTHLPAGPAEALLADLVEARGAPETWAAAHRYRLAKALLRTDRRRAADLVGGAAHQDEVTRQDEVARLAVLAVLDPGGAADLAERILRTRPDSWTMREIAAALLGEPAAPGAAALRPLARSCVMAVLDDDGSWSAALPLLADLEPAAVLAVHRRLRDLRGAAA